MPRLINEEIRQIEVQYLQRPEQRCSPDLHLAIAEHFYAEGNATAEAALQVDVAELWRVTNAIKKAIQAREWITEGRGSYEWDDERYRQEARAAFDETLALIEQVQHPAQQRFVDAMSGELEKQLSKRETEGKAEGKAELLEALKERGRLVRYERINTPACCGDYHRCVDAKTGNPILWEELLPEDHPCLVVIIPEEK